MDIATLSRNLGHANISTTLNMYVHWMDDQQRASVQIFDMGQLEVGVDEDDADSSSVLPEQRVPVDAPNPAALAVGFNVIPYDTVRKARRGD